MEKITFRIAASFFTILNHKFCRSTVFFQWDGKKLAKIFSVFLRAFSTFLPNFFFTSTNLSSVRPVQMVNIIFLVNSSTKSYSHFPQSFPHPSTPFIPTVTRIFVRFLQSLYRRFPYCKIPFSFYIIFLFHTFSTVFSTPAHLLKLRLDNPSHPFPQRQNASGLLRLTSIPLREAEEFAIIKSCQHAVHSFHPAAFRRPYG